VSYKQSWELLLLIIESYENINSSIPAKEIKEIMTHLRKIKWEKVEE